MSARPTRTAPAKKRVPRKVSDEPSAESLKEIPELSPDAVFLGHGREGMKVARALSRAMRGRPRKGEQAAGSSTRSLKLTDAQWEVLDALAAKLEISAHAAMREAVIHWIARTSDKLPTPAAEPRAKPVSKHPAKSKPAKRAQA